MNESGLDARGHRGKSLQHILDTLPRDDLFQASLDELRAISFGVLVARAAAQAQAVLPARDVRPLLLVPRLSAARSVQRARAARDRGRSAREPQRHRRRERARDLRVGARAARGHGADVGRASSASPTLPALRARARRRRYGRGKTACARRCSRSCPRSARSTCCIATRSNSRRLIKTRRTARARAHDMQQLARLDESGADLEITLARAATARAPAAHDVQARRADPALRRAADPREHGASRVARARLSAAARRRAAVDPGFRARDAGQDGARPGRARRALQGLLRGRAARRRGERQLQLRSS